MGFVNKLPLGGIAGEKSSIITNRSSTMGEKIQLPDAILDAMSGGVFTLDGQKVTDISITDDGMSISCAGQTFNHTWSASEKADLMANPHEFAMFKEMMKGMQGSSSTYDLQQTLKMFDD